MFEYSQQEMCALCPPNSHCWGSGGSHGGKRDTCCDGICVDCDNVVQVAWPCSSCPVGNFCYAYRVGDGDICIMCRSCIQYPNFCAQPYLFPNGTFADAALSRSNPNCDSYIERCPVSAHKYGAIFSK